MPNRMLTHSSNLPHSGEKRGKWENQKPREVKTEVAVETAGDLREDPSHESAEAPGNNRCSVWMDHKMLESSSCWSVLDSCESCSVLQEACGVAGEMICWNNDKAISNIHLSFSDIQFHTIISTDLKCSVL